MKKRAADPANSLSLGLLTSLTALLTITPYSVDAFLPAMPSMAEDLGVTASATQLSLTAFLLGIAAGQLVFGPLSDRLGRRRPLIIGASLCALGAVICAFAPNITVLVLGRLVQGIAGASGMVIGRAIVRDRTTGDATAKALATMAVGSGALNILSPVLGGALTEWLGWRGPLWFLVALTVALLVLTATTVPETHSHEARDTGSRWHGLTSIGRHLQHRTFRLYVIIQAGSFATLMAYVSSSPFVYQGVLGFDEFTFGVLFSINVAAGVLVNFIGNHLLRGVGPRRLVAWGFLLSLCGATATGVTWLLDAPPLVVAAAITLSMAPLGLNGPNLVGLALNQVARSAGSAAATIGFAQFCSGSAVAPILGLWGPGTLAPMVIAMIALASSSLLVLALARSTQQVDEGTNGAAPA